MLFKTVVLEKILESPLDCTEFKSDLQEDLGKIIENARLESNKLESRLSGEISEIISDM